MFLKQKFQIFLIIIIANISFYFIFFGQRGIIRYYQLANEIEHEQKQVKKLERKNEKLKAKIDRWSKDDFEKEKFARQHLQMARPNELVFVSTQTTTNLKS